MDIVKENRAIEYLRNFEPKDQPYYLCYSGGKDSDAVRILAELAGVKYELIHNLTTVDAPETVKYVKQMGARIERPQKTMWQLIVENGVPPTQLMRYCCKYLKERSGIGRMKVTGVRRAESVNRAKNNDFIKIIGKPKTTQKKAIDMGIEYGLGQKGGLVLNNDDDITRQFVEHCYRTTAVMLNPIVDWTDNDVWEFLHYHGCESNPLYQCGYKRIGCIGCPMKGRKGMKDDLARYPKYRENYIKAFDRMLVRRKELGKTSRLQWNSGEEVMQWWVGENPIEVTEEEFEIMLDDVDRDLLT